MALRYLHTAFFPDLMMRKRPVGCEDVWRRLDTRVLGLLASLRLTKVVSVPLNIYCS
jgi:hypothetical protein